MTTSNVKSRASTGSTLLKSIIKANHQRYMTTIWKTLFSLFSFGHLIAIFCLKVSSMLHLTTTLLGLVYDVLVFKRKIKIYENIKFIISKTIFENGDVGKKQTTYLLLCDSPLKGFVVISLFIPHSIYLLGNSDIISTSSCRTCWFILKETQRRKSVPK